MKKLRLIIIINFIIIDHFSQTNFQGGIYKNTEWTISNSPYIITGDIVVFPDKTLTIKPGVEIQFSGNYFFEVRGKIIAIGNENDSIIINSNISPERNIQDIGIRINYSNAEFNFSYCKFDKLKDAIIIEKSDFVKNSEINNCSFINCINAIKNEVPNLLIDKCKFINNEKAVTGPSIKITNSEFYKNEYCLSTSDTISVENCSFIDNQYGGIGVRIKAKNSLFKNNEIGLLELWYTVLDNTQFEGNKYGVYLIHVGTIKNSIFENNEIGISFTSIIALQNNIIKNNDVGIQVLSVNESDEFFPIKFQSNEICNNSIFNVENLSNINLNFSNNCWCTSDSATIEDKLFDGYDDIHSGLINYDIFDENCENILKSRKKVDMGIGIEMTELNQSVNLYPVIFSSILHIRTQFSDLEKYSISIYNLQGKKMYNDTHIGNHVTLNLEYLNSEIYLCIVKNGNYVITKKIIKK